MTDWTAEQLAALHDVEEIRITPAPSGGEHPGRLIWVLEIGGRVFVRSWKGPTAAWYAQSLQTHRARITTQGDGPGVDLDVRLLEAHDDDDAVDAAYLAKYPGDYAAQMNVPLPRATTLELLPA